MAIFKPEMPSSGSSSSFTGICEFGLVEFEDKSGQFDWADLFLEVKVRQKGSDYDRTMQIKGSFEKEAGKITGGSCLKRLYQFFSEIGCEAGITVDGTWESSDGQTIDNIASYLNEHFIKSNPVDGPSHDYIGYFYQEQPKVPGGKSYTRVWNKIMKNTEDNKSKLMKDAEWMKAQGYIKEMTDVVPNGAVTTGLSGSGLSNL
tara:strand:+ start:1637 stop:2245 length:609 start_codon:yes stop_codon:yes gene_type:complete